MEKVRTMLEEQQDAARSLVRMQLIEHAIFFPLLVFVSFAMYLTVRCYQGTHAVQSMDITRPI